MKIIKEPTKPMIVLDAEGYGNETE